MLLKDTYRILARVSSPIRKNTKKCGMCMYVLLAVGCWHYISQFRYSCCSWQRQNTNRTKYLLAAADAQLRKCVCVYLGMRVCDHLLRGKQINKHA